MTALVAVPPWPLGVAPQTPTMHNTAPERLRRRCTAPFASFPACILGHVDTYTHAMASEQRKACDGIPLPLSMTACNVACMHARMHAIQARIITPWAAEVGCVRLILNSPNSLRHQEEDSGGVRVRALQAGLRDPPQFAAEAARLSRRGSQA